MNSVTPASLLVEMAQAPSIGRYEFVWRIAESLGLEPEFEQDESGLTPCQLEELERRMNGDDPGIPAEQMLPELRGRLRSRREAIQRLPPALRPRRPQDIEADALNMSKEDRHAILRPLVASLLDHPWYADEMRSLSKLL